MAKIVLEYDSKNAIAQKTIDCVLSLGVFKTDDTKHKKNALDISIEHAKKGQTHKAKNAADLIKQCLA